MDFDWKKLLGTVAPTLATAAGGPLAGMAVKAIGDALGLNNATVEAVTTALKGASPDDLLKLKQADQAFQSKMAELGVDLAKLEQADRESARDLVKAGAKTPGVLSWLVIIGTFVLYGWLVVNGQPSDKLDDVVLGRILGTLDVAFGVVLNFWLGTSFSSRSKDETIKQMAA